MDWGLVTKIIVMWLFFVIGMCLMISQVNTRSR